MIKIYEDSKNYTCQVIKLPPIQKIDGLDNLVKVTHQGNDCLIGKDIDSDDDLYLFFPSECQISHEFLSKNNLYRNLELNEDKTKKGFFEDNRRCKSIKFKGVISTGFIIPIGSLMCCPCKSYDLDLKVGDEFNELGEFEVCKKYYKKVPGLKGFSNPKVKTIDNIVDNVFAPQHKDTEHLLKYANKLRLDDYISVTVKLHGTSFRIFNTQVKRNLTWKDKLAKLLGVEVKDTKYDYVVGSRKVLKSVGFEELPNKNHWFTSGDLWSEVGKKYFEGKLLEEECVYAEIIGKTFQGEEIQGGYSYGFNEPKVYIYRISNINNQGIEVDLPYLQMKERAKQLGIETCPELFYGTLSGFIDCYNEGYINIEESLNKVFYEKLLEKPSVLDNSIIEEGFVIRIDKYPKPEAYKIKAKSFLLKESGNKDKEVKDLEEEQLI